MRQSHCKCVTQHVLEFRSPDSTTRDSRFLGGGGKEDSRLRFSEPPHPGPDHPELTRIWNLWAVERLPEWQGLERVETGKNFHHSQSMGIQAANVKKAWRLEPKTAVY